MAESIEAYIQTMMHGAAEHPLSRQEDAGDEAAKLWQ